MASNIWHAGLICVSPASWPDCGQVRSSWMRSGGGIGSSVKHCDITCMAGSSNHPFDSTPPETQSPVVPSRVTHRTAQSTAGFRVNAPVECDDVSSVGVLEFLHIPGHPIASESCLKDLGYSGVSTDLIAGCRQDRRMKDNILIEGCYCSQKIVRFQRSRESSLWHGGDSHVVGKGERRLGLKPSRLTRSSLWVVIPEIDIWCVANLILKR